MQVIQKIKIERLLLALGMTLLIADTVPHPNLSAGLVEHTLHWVQAELMQESCDAIWQYFPGGFGADKNVHANLNLGITIHAAERDPMNVALVGATECRAADAAK